MFELSPYYEEVLTQLFIFAVSFLSVFYGVQLSKFIAKQYDKKRKATTCTNTLLTTLPLEDYVPMALIQKDVLSHDTVKFTFALPNAQAVLGLPTGQHVSLKYYHPTTNDDDDATTQQQQPPPTAVQRSYTPVSDNTTVGTFSLVIKVYRPLLPKFPTGGKMSQHLDHLQLHDTILVHGPKGHTEYHGNGKITVKPLGKKLVEHRTSRHIGMMAGGTGITPMLQILHHIFIQDAVRDKNTQVHLIYANQTEDDILVRTELETLQRNFPTRFSLWYTIDRYTPPTTTTSTTPDTNDATTTTTTTKVWKYDIGFITSTMIEQHLVFPKSVRDTQFFMCGPPPMIKFACLPALQALGYTEKDWITF
jgi:cytochrome-b5 reductase